MALRRAFLVFVLLVAGAVPAASVGVSSATDAPPASGDADPVLSVAGVENDVRESTVVSNEAVSAATATTSDGDIHQRKTLALTPDTPGSIRTTVDYDLPDSVSELEVTLPERASVTETRGFDRVGDRQFAWDGSTDSPTLVFAFTVNQTFGGARAHSVANRSTGDAEVDAAATEGWAFVDPGPWALTTVPSLSVSWRYRSTAQVALQRSLAIDGEGATGGEIAYLGPLSTYEREANGQRFTLAVPAAAEMRADREAVFDSLAHASGALVVGARDPDVFYVVAPDGVNWGPRGLEYGGSDAWVRQDATLDTATNVWLHEYVHTRQAYEPTTATRWTTEGTADYYAALLTLRQGHIGFDAFADHLRRGTNERYADAVLADPSSWDGSANYLKGALVFGTIDHRIRLAGDQSADAVLARMNSDGGTLTQSEFLAAVEAAGGSEVRAAAERYTETAEAPEMWARTEHYETFPATSAVRYDFENADLRVSGPYRNRSVDSQTTLGTGETLTVTVPVENPGDDSATYELVVQRNGSTVASDAGSIAAGAERTVTLTVDLTRPGTYTVAAGVTALPLTVREPAPIRVTEISVPSSVPAGATVTAEATVVGAADRPASGTVRWTFMGTDIGRETVTLDAQGRTTVTTMIGASTPGTATLSANNRSVQVTITESQSDDVEQENAGTTSRPTPLSWLSVVAGLSLAVLVLVRKNS